MEFHTNKTVKGKFLLPELHEDKLIERDVHLTKDLGQYDLIFEQDILEFIQLDISFSDQTVKWDGVEIMIFKNSNQTMYESFNIQESGHADTATSRLKRILEAKYEAADSSDFLALLHRKLRTKANM